MVIYTSMKERRLAKLVRNKSITDHTSKPETPIKAGLMTALQAVDVSSKPFRFMELSPELRTHIYCELLVIKSSWACYPQILAVSPNIKAEATNILYGENLIEVKIWPDEVQAHGIRCGAYRPDHGNPDMQYLQWPEMLRRIQWLRVSLPQIETLLGYSSEPPLPRVAMSVVMYSLCGFLADNNNLRSFELDLRPLRLQADSSDYMSLIYPLTMLGKLQDITIRISKEKTIKLSNSTIHHPPQRTADIQIFTFARRLCKDVQAYLDITDKISILNVRDELGQAHDELYDSLHNWSGLHDAEWEQDTAEAMECLQLALVQANLIQSREQKLAEVHETLEEAEWLQRSIVDELPGMQG